MLIWIFRALFTITAATATLAAVARAETLAPATASTAALVTNAGIASTRVTTRAARFGRWRRRQRSGNRECRRHQKDGQDHQYGSRHYYLLIEETSKLKMKQVTQFR